MKIHENPYDIMQIYEHVINTMKVFRGQEASLESSRVFYKGSKSNLAIGKIMTPDAQKSIEIFENVWKPMRINENLWKSVKVYEML